MLVKFCVATIGVCVFRCGGFGCRTFLFGKNIFDVDISNKKWYTVFATQTTYFFSTTGKYFGKKCFLPFLTRC